jgi:hypothetical protein
MHLRWSLPLLLLLCAAIVRSTPTGACCTAPDECTVETETACTDTEEGRYVADGTNCSTANCNAYTSCCLPSGECGILTPLECSDEGGLDRGNFDNTSGFCVIPDCTVTAGCCEEGGFTGCLNLISAACLALGWKVGGADCQDEANLCIGACCTGGGCSQVTPMECPEPAVYNGNLVDCSNVCQNTPGACCLESGACITKAEYGCFIEDGVFQGRLTECSNTSCPVPRHPAALWMLCTVLLLPQPQAEALRPAVSLLIAQSRRVCRTEKTNKQQPSHEKPHIPLIKLVLLTGESSSPVRESGTVGWSGALC